MDAKVYQKRYVFDSGPVERLSDEATRTGEVQGLIDKKLRQCGSMFHCQSAAIEHPHGINGSISVEVYHVPPEISLVKRVSLYHLPDHNKEKPGRKIEVTAASANSASLDSFFKDFEAGLPPLREYYTF